MIIISMAVLSISLYIADRSGFNRWSVSIAVTIILIAANLISLINLVISLVLNFKDIQEEIIRKFHM